VKTRLGDIIIATSYIPPRIGYMHYPDYYKLLSRKVHVYFLGDMNARHVRLGYSSNKSTGEQVSTLIDRNHARWEGPHFPTLITHRSKTSPDIILTNHYTYHNTYAKVGPNTPSDHYPIVYTITTQPIQIPIKPRPSYCKAKWNNYKAELEHHPIINITNITPNELEEELTKWTEQIQKASKVNIPTTEYRTLIRGKTTEKIKRANIIHDAILQNILRYGPTPERMHAISRLRYLLIEEYKAQRTKAWDDLIENLDTERNDGEFWKTIKRLKGVQTNKEQKYLRDERGREVHDDEGKEVLFRRYWERIFRKHQEEDEEFDKTHYRNITTSIIANQLQFQHYEHFNFSDNFGINGNLTTLYQRNKTKSSWPRRCNQVSIN
jgi:hypothetical protein